MVVGEPFRLPRLALALGLAWGVSTETWSQTAQPGGGQSRPSAAGPGRPGETGPGESVLPGDRMREGLDRPDSDALPRGPLGGADQLGIPGDPAGRALQPGMGLPPTSTTVPYNLVIPGSEPTPSLDDARTEALESAVLARITEIAEPLEKAQALERFALTKLRARQLEDAHRTLLEAAETALQGRAGLRRDLRLIGLVDAILDTAAAQIIEGLSSSLPSSSSGVVGDLPPALEGERMARLEQAQAEWRLAYHLATSMDNINYRSEQLTKAAARQAEGSQSIARSGLRGSLLPLAPDLPRMELLNYADGLLVEATEQSRKIPRVVWRDRALIEVASIAAESMQLARARSIAASIPNPSYRTEALVRDAESLVLLSYRVNSELPRFLNDAWSRYLSTLQSTRTNLETDLALDRASSLDEAYFSFQRKQDALNELLAATISLDQRIELLNQLVQNAQVARVTAYPGRHGTVPLRRSEQFEADFNRIGPQITNAKNRLKEQLRTAGATVSQQIEEARSKNLRNLRPDQDPYIEIAQSLPKADDPAMVDLGADLNVLVQSTINLGPQALLPEATEVYNLAAEAVASIGDPDPRSDSAQVLITSLISTNRFQDARAAVQLLPDNDRKLAALGEIAEAQGRRGLADSAFAWIASEVAEPYRAQLIRQVESGVLATVDENRLRRAMGTTSR